MFSPNGFDPARQVHAGEIVKGDAFEHFAIVENRVHDDAFAGLVDDREVAVEERELLLHSSLDSRGLFFLVLAFLPLGLFIVAELKILGDDEIGRLPPPLSPALST